MSDNTADTLHHRASKGMQMLFGRQVVTQVMGLAGGILLARRLNPADFGVYAIITFLVNVFTLVGDLGLTASYIQREAEIETRQLHLSFTLQLGLATFITLLVWLLAPWALHWYPALSSEAVWMARAFVLTLYFPAFRSISAVQLERHLQYAPIARAEMVEMAVYQSAAVLLAFGGCGVWSFIVATLLRGLAGTVLLYCAAPWPIRLHWDKQEARRILGYSISFQMGGIMNAVGNWATPTLVGMLIGPQAVGYLGNATANANRPLVVVEAVMRVSFPHFSRMQTDAAQLKEVVITYICGFAWIVSLWMALLWAVGTPLIALVYSAKWIPSVSALKLFAAALPCEVVCWTMGFCYSAVNRNWVVVRIVGMRSLLMLMLAAILVPRCGFTGIAWATLLAAAFAAVLLLARFDRGFLQETLRRIVWIAFCVAGGTACGLLSLQAIGASGWAHLLFQCVGGGAVTLGAYVGLSLLLAPAQYRRQASAMLQRATGTFRARWGGKETAA